MVKMRNNGKKFGAGVPIVGQKMVKHQLGGITIETPNSPLELVAQAGGFTADTAATFVAVSLELQVRDAEIERLRGMVERLTLVAENGLEVIGELERRLDGLEGVPQAKPDNGTTRIELDPDELERDYFARVDRIAEYAKTKNIPIETICRMAEVEPFGPGKQGEAELDRLRKVEQYLNQHGGREWSP